MSKRQPGQETPITDALENVAEVTDAAASRLDRIGERAVKAADAGRERVAHRLDRMARALHNGADAVKSGAATMGEAGHHAAERVDDAARYLRQESARDMLGDLEAMVRRHPARTVLAVLALGYVAGRLRSRGI